MNEWTIMEPYLCQWHDKFTQDLSELALLMKSLAEGSLIFLIESPQVSHCPGKKKYSN